MCVWKCAFKLNWTNLQRFFQFWSNSQHSNGRDQTTLSPTRYRVFEISDKYSTFRCKVKVQFKTISINPVRSDARAANLFFRHFFGFSRRAVPAPESFSDWFFEKLPRALVEFCQVTKSLSLNCLGYTSVAKRSSGRHF